MTVFGDARSFAIELTPSDSLEWATTLWISGERIGDTDWPSTAYAVLIDLEYLLESAPDRQDDVLFAKTDGACLDIIYGGKYGEEPSDFLHIEGLRRGFSTLLLSPGMFESLDLFLVVAVDSIDESRIMARKLKGSEILSARLPKGQIESPMRDAIRFILAKAGHNLLEADRHRFEKLSLNADTSIS